MARRRARQELRNISGIDITPLVDLTFLLLIVFMITAPVLEFAVTVQTPELNAEPIEDRENRIVSLDREGQVWLDRDRVATDALAGRLLAIHERHPDLQVFVRADERRPYGEVMGIMRQVRRAGIADVSLVTEAETE